MELKLELKRKVTKTDTSKLVEKAKEKRAAANETIEEALDRIGSMKLTEREQAWYDLARESLLSGKVGRIESGKMTKGEVLTIGSRIAKEQESEIREKRIKQTLETKPDNFHILTDDSEIDRFLSRLREEVTRQSTEWEGRWSRLGVKSMTAGDYEGTGLDAYMDLSIGFSIWLPLLNEGYYLPYGHLGENVKQLTRSKVIAALAPYMESEEHGKTFHMGAARYDLHVAANDGYEINALVWDTLDAMNMLNEHLPSYGLKPLTQAYGKYYGIEGEVFTFEDLFGNGSPAPYDVELVGIYAIKDVLYGWKLMEWQYKMMEKTGRLLDCYTEIDGHLPAVDAFMVRSGFEINHEEMARLEAVYTEKLEEAKRNLYEAYSIDDDFLHKMSMTLNGKKIETWKSRQKTKLEKAKEALRKAQDIARECEINGKTHLKKYEQAKANIEKNRRQVEELESLTEKDCPDYITEFSFTNGNHIGYLIYDHLGIKDKTGRVQRGKERSTAANVLEMYYEDEEALKPLANVAAYEKLLGTYVKKIPQTLEFDGRFHCLYKAGGTATGRYSSSGYSGRRVDLLDDLLGIE